MNEITHGDLRRSGLDKYDKFGSIIPWKDSPDGKLRITEFWGKERKFIYKDHQGYYCLTRQSKNRCDLSTVSEIILYLNL